MSFKILLFFIIFVSTTFTFIEAFDTSAENKSKTSNKANSKVFYIDNPYARDKFGKSLCGAAEIRKATISPINLDLQTIRKGQFKQDLSFTGLDLTPESITVRNTGYELSIEPKYNETTPTINNGPLERPYTFNRIRVVFGKDDQGSEHAINGLKYAAEFQLIFFREDVGPINASFTPDSTVIFSLLFELSNDSSIFDLKDAFEQITESGKSVKLTKNLPSLKDFMTGYSNFLFATYKGSYTFPPCTSNVIWIINLNVEGISKDLLNQARKLQDPFGNSLASTGTSIQENKNRPNVLLGLFNRT